LNSRYAAHLGNCYCNFTIDDTIQLLSLFLAKQVSLSDKLREAKMHPAITQVWKQNFEAEISRLDRAFFNHRVISIDAESPGFIRDTRRELSTV
jgi:hypothetical protein